MLFRFRYASFQILEVGLDFLVQLLHFYRVVFLVKFVEIEHFLSPSKLLIDVRTNTQVAKCLHIESVELILVGYLG